MIHNSSVSSKKAIIYQKKKEVDVYVHVHEIDKMIIKIELLWWDETMINSNYGQLESSHVRMRFWIPFFEFLNEEHEIPSTKNIERTKQLISTKIVICDKSISIPTSWSGSLETYFLLITFSLYIHKIYIWHH